MTPMQQATETTNRKRSFHRNPTVGMHYSSVLESLLYPIVITDTIPSLDFSGYLLTAVLHRDTVTFLHTCPLVLNT